MSKSGISFSMRLVLEKIGTPMAGLLEEYGRISHILAAISKRPTFLLSKGFSTFMLSFTPWQNLKVKFTPEISLIFFLF